MIIIFTVYYFIIIWNEAVFAFSASDAPLEARGCLLHPEGSHETPSEQTLGLSPLARQGEATGSSGTTEGRIPLT